MNIEKLFTTVLLITILSACSPRVSEETPIDNNKNLLGDAVEVVEIGEKVNEEVGNTVEDSVDNTVESTISELFGGKIGEFLGDKAGDAAGRAAGIAVKKSLGENFFKVKDKIERITGMELSNQQEERFFQTEIIDVVDSDTVKIRYKGKNLPLRILYINGPEDTKTKEWLGDKATEFAVKSLEGKTVTIELSEKGNPTDKYGRLLGSIFIGETLYQELILAEGLAIVQYVYEPDTKYEDYLRSIEEQARKEKKNVWSIDGYVKPGNNGYDMSVIN